MSQQTQTFIVRELQNAQSRREGTRIRARDLSAAKKAASRAQVFNGTVLVIESESGARLSMKQAGQKWVDSRN